MKEDEKVLTVSGNYELLSSCRKMNNEYYKIGDVTKIDSGDCYLINEKYRKVKTKFIIYDHSIGRYVLKGEFKNNNYYTEKGIVNFENDKPIMGAFSYKSEDDIIFLTLLNGERFICINETIVKNNFYYKENLSNGEYYHRQFLDSIKFNNIKPCDQSYKNSLNYDSRGIMDDYINNYNKNYSIPESNSLLKDLDFNVTKNYTFGVEFETSKGSIPHRICNKLGLLPLRDGSIQGLEYVTIPLQGNKGVSAISSILEELKYRTEYDDDCSLHIHIGNLPRTESFFLSLYKLLFMLQDEIFDLFPLYKKQNLNIKRKHYTKPFPYKETIMMLDKNITPDNIKSNFNVLYRFLSMGYNYDQVGCNINNIKAHPSDPGGNSKWNIRTRYHFVNLIPLLFGNKETIEFRIHTSTVDKAKVINYLILCCAIIDYAINNEKMILESSSSLINKNLRNIVMAYFNNMPITSEKSKSHIINMREELINYLFIRKDYIYERLKQGDIICNEDNLKYSHRYFDWNVLNKKNIKQPSKVINNYSMPLYNENIQHIHINEIQPNIAQLDPVAINEVHDFEENFNLDEDDE